VLQSGEGLDALAEVLGAEDAEAAFGQFAASLLMAVNAMHVDGVVHRGARASVERGLTSAKPLSPAAAVSESRTDPVRRSATSALRHTRTRRRFPDCGLRQLGCSVE